MSTYRRILRELDAILAAAPPLPSPRQWSEVHLAVLREHYADTPSAVLARAMGCSVHRVYFKAQQLGLHKSAAYRHNGNATHERRDKRYWTAAQLAVLRLKYADTPSAELARELGRRPEHVHNKANRLGLAKSPVDSAKVEVDYLKVSGGGESTFIDSGVGRDNLPPGITGIRQHRLKG